MKKPERATEKMVNKNCNCSAKGNKKCCIKKAPATTREVVQATIAYERAFWIKQEANFFRY